MLQFVLLGAALFVVLSLLGTSDEIRTRPIVIDTSVEARLSKLYELQAGSPPGPAQLESLIQDFIRDEVLYREAVAVGLDQDER
ncbi:MAG: hypothetical protein ABI645_00040 [Pseudomonadota bacterium]